VSSRRVVIAAFTVTGAVALIVVVGYLLNIALFETENLEPMFVVEVYDPEKAYPGTTFFTDSHDSNNPRVLEVDMNGNIIWQFTIPQEWRPGGEIVGFEAELLPDNHILLAITRSGLYEIDRSGNLIWSYEDPKVSHDADRLPNGNTLYVYGADDQENDAVVKEVSPQGTIVWSWYARDHYLQRFPPQQYAHQGWTHTNAVQRLSNGNTLINMRNLYMTTIVDENGDIVKEYDWSKYGADTDPHEPQLYENENLLIVCLQNDSPYVVVEVDAENGEEIWTYSNSYLRTARDADKLPNGNVLIVAVHNGGTSDYVNMEDDTSVITQERSRGQKPGLVLQG